MLGCDDLVLRLDVLEELPMLLVMIRNLVVLLFFFFDLLAVVGDLAVSLVSVQVARFVIISCFRDEPRFFIFFFLTLVVNALVVILILLGLLFFFFLQAC